MTVKTRRSREIEAAVVVREKGIGSKLARRWFEGTGTLEKSVVRSIC